MTRRAYVQLADGRQTHYRRAGAGEPLILLHPSPLSSTWLEPVIEAVRGRVDAIAPDTPGYGASDPLPEPSGRPDGNGRQRGGRVPARADGNGRRDRAGVRARADGPDNGRRYGAERVREQGSGDGTEEVPEQGPQDGPDCGLAPYVAWLLEFVRALGFERVGLYGSATGAQIAVEFARVHPRAARFLVLDNLAHLTADERGRMLARYFPDLSPRADGSHLKAAWSMVTGFGQWFPWYEQNEEHRIGTPDSVPAAARQRMLVDHLRAGPGYARAYRAALRNEDAARVQAVTVPVRIVRWQGSVLRRHADRLDGFDWPAHIRMVACGPGMQRRLDAIRGAVGELSGPAGENGAAGAA